MEFRDFWLKLNNGKEINLDNFKGEISKNSFSSNFSGIFDIFDSNKDGKLSSMEIRNCWERIKLQASLQQEKSIFDNDEATSFLLKKGNISNTSEDLFNFLGELFNKTEAKRIKSTAQEFYQIADDNSGINSMEKMLVLLKKKINSDNIMLFLNAYKESDVRKGDSSIIDTITSEIGASGSKQQRAVLEFIIDTLCEQAKVSNVREEDIEFARTQFINSMEKEFNSIRRINPKDMEKALTFLQGAIVAAKTDKVEMKENDARKTLAQNFAEENLTVKKEFEKAKNGVDTDGDGEKEGGWNWAAKTGDWVCGLFGCNTIKDLEKKLGDNAYLAKLLVASAETGKTIDETTGKTLTFNEIYKKLTGVDFDPQKIAAAEKTKEKLENILSSGGAEIEYAMEIYNSIINKIKSSKFNTNEQIKTNLIEELKWTEDEYNNFYTQYLKENGDKSFQDYVIKHLEESTSTFSDMLNNLTGGKSIKELQEEYELIIKSTYGTNDIAKDFEQFNQNMVATESITIMAAEIAGTIALSMVPGVGQYAMAKLALNATQWGAKGTKIINLAKNSQKVLSTIQKFQTGQSFKSSTLNLGSKMVMGATNSAVATVGVNLTNDKTKDEIIRKTLTNALFGMSGVASTDLAPKLMSLLKIEKRVAIELAEEILNLPMAYGITKLSGTDYTEKDAILDLAMGLIMQRITGGASKPKLQLEPPPLGGKIEVLKPKPDFGIESNTYVYRDKNGKIVKVVRNELTENYIYNDNGDLIETYMDTEDGRYSKIFKYTEETNETQVLIKDPWDDEYYKSSKVKGKFGSEDCSKYTFISYPHKIPENLDYLGKKELAKQRKISDLEIPIDKNGVFTSQNVVANSDGEIIYTWDLEGNITGYCIKDRKYLEERFYSYNASGDRIEISAKEFGNLQKKNSEIYHHKSEFDSNLYVNKIYELFYQRIKANDTNFDNVNIFKKVIELARTKEDLDIIETLLLLKSKNGKKFELSASDLNYIFKNEKLKNFVFNKIKNKEPISIDDFKKIDPDYTKNTTYTKTIRKASEYEILDIKFTTKNPIDEYRENPFFRKKIQEKVPAGEVANINGKLYCHTGDEIVELNLTKEKFEELFPHNQRYHTAQGNLGDCWLISTMGALMDTPNGRLSIYKLFRQEGNDIYIKFPGKNSPDIKFTDGKLNSLSLFSLYFKDKSLKFGTGDAHVQSYKGLRILEQAFSIQRYHRYSNSELDVNDIFFMNKQMQDLKGGGSTEALWRICGRDNVKEVKIDPNYDFEYTLTTLLENPNGIIHFGVKKKGNNLITQHQYELVGYDSNTGLVSYINPWRGSTVESMPLWKLMEHQPDEFEGYIIGE